MSIKTPKKESKDGRGAGGGLTPLLGDQVPPQNLLSRLATGCEACSSFPSRTKGSLELLGLGGPECQGDITPRVYPSPQPTASATALQPPLFIVSVSCLLVLSAATLRQKPAKQQTHPGEQSAALS